MKHEIAVADESGEIKIFDNLDGTLKFLDSTSHGSSVTSIAFSPDGQFLVSGDEFGKLLVWNSSNWI